MKTLLIAVLLISGCASYGPPMRNDFHHDTVTVTVHYTDVIEISRHCPPTAAVYAQGCASFNAANSKCDIYVPKPKGQKDGYAFGIIGHELLHCTDGAFHDAERTEPINMNR